MATIVAALVAAVAMRGASDGIRKRYCDDRWVRCVFRFVGNSRTLRQQRQKHDCGTWLDVHSVDSATAVGSVALGAIAASSVVVVAVAVAAIVVAPVDGAFGAHLPFVVVVVAPRGVDDCMRIVCVECFGLELWCSYCCCCLMRSMVGGFCWSWTDWWAPSSSVAANVVGMWRLVRVFAGFGIGRT